MINNSASNEPNADQVATNFARWFAAMEASHTMLMAGLRDQVGPDGDVQKAYRDWKDAYRSRKQRAYQQAAKRHAERANEQINGSPDAS